MGLNSLKVIENRIFSTLGKEVEAVSGLSKSIFEIVSAVSLLSRRKGKIIITGVGKSAFIGMKMAATFTSLGHHAFFLHPVDALHGDSGVVFDGDIVIAVSFSGESNEVLKVIRHIKKTFLVKVIAITRSKKSSLRKLADKSITIRIKDEGSPSGLAPMASTTASLVVGDLLAVGLVDPKKYKDTHFAKFHPGGSLGLRLKTVEETMIKGSKMPMVRGETLFKKAILEISKKRKGVVGVLDRLGKLVGVLTDGDVRRFFTLHDSSSGVSVKDVMTTNPKIISATDSLERALEIMERFKITTLFVTTKGKKVIGLIHLHDIIEATS
ncbi:MAG: KpsF/GutQ family sugar-phosphate isomerase [Patescibacteria group bacterium]